MCFRFVPSFLITLKQNKLSTLRPQQEVQNQGSCCEDGKPKENPPQLRRYGEGEWSLVTLLKRRTSDWWVDWSWPVYPQKRSRMGLVVGCCVFCGAENKSWLREMSVLMLDVWLVRERCGRLWLDKEEQAGSGKQEQIVIQRPCRESLIEH